MISDVLWEALQDLRDYRRMWPDAYRAVSGDLDNLMARMDALRATLDTPPDSAPNTPARCLRCHASDHLGWLYTQGFVTNAEHAKIRTRVYRKRCGCTKVTT